MKYGYRTPSLNKSIAAKLSVSRLLKQELGFGKGLIPDLKKSRYNRKYAKRVKKLVAPKFTGIQSGRIEHIQAILKQLGYFTGKLTGQLDAKTIKSIMDFQKACNIMPSGLLDFQTLTRLDKEKRKKDKKK